MIKNYLTTAIQNLIRNKTYSTINILGLSGGLTCCLLIFIFVTDEYSYDKFHAKKERIYR
jgi:putative ABC transport system permease protein